MNDNLFRLIASVIFIAGAAISIYYRRKAEKQSEEKISLKEEGLPILVTLRLFGLILWATIFAFLINPAWISFMRIDLPEWARWVGVAMGLAADGLAYWVFKSLGNNVSPTVATRKNHTLVTQGPYRWVRHPLYTMGMLSYLGFALLAENWFVALLAVIAFIVLNIRLPKEEAQLIARFGDEYQTYMQHTGKFLPKLNR